MPEPPFEFALTPSRLSTLPLPRLLLELGVQTPPNRLRRFAGAVARTAADRLELVAGRLEARTGRAAILMYHKIHRAPRNPWGEPVLDARAFEAHCAFLARHANVVPLREVIHCLAENEPLPPKAVALTFDDGFRGVLELALPALKKHRLAAAVFVVTGLCGTERWLWPFEVEEMVRVHGAPGVCRGSGDPIIERLGRENLVPLYAAFALVEYLKRLPPGRLAPILGRLRDRAPVDLDEDNRFLTWAEVRALASEGVEVGSHTASHAILPTLLDEEVEREVSESKAALSQQLGAPPAFFCYPNGNLSPSSRAIVQRHHAAALATRPGENFPGGDLYALKRICASVEVRDLAFSLAFANRA
ncbi:MAG: polysaccharide deacetylase family protein [Myxococcales bacterium]